MNFYLLETGEGGGFGELRRIVVRAPGELVAREIAAGEHGTEGEGVWESASRSSCEKLDQNEGQGVVLRQFGPPANK